MLWYFTWRDTRGKAILTLAQRFPRLKQLKLHLFLLPKTQNQRKVPVDGKWTSLLKKGKKNLVRLKPRHRHKNVKLFWGILFGGSFYFAKSHAICFYNLTREKNSRFSLQKNCFLFRDAMLLLMLNMNAGNIYVNSLLFLHVCTYFNK